jgi:hypothetical protein
LGLVLGIEDILRLTNYYTIDDIQELFIYKQKQLKLWYSFYKNTRFKLKIFKPFNIIGFKGVVYNKADIYPIYSLNITTPNSIKEQYIFKN